MRIRILILLTCWILSLTVCEDARGQLVLPKRKPLKMLALGDSYTIGESVPENERWPEQLAARLREKGLTVDKPVIIAKTGWRTDQLKDAVSASGQPDDFNLVSLLIGVNNQYQKRTVEAYAPEFEELLKIAIAKAGGRKSNVFVVSIPDYGFTPFGENRRDRISTELDQFNARNKEIATQMGVLWIDITDISRRGLTEPELVASDKLHPSGRMYAEWVGRMLTYIRVK